MGQVMLDLCYTCKTYACATEKTENAFRHHLNELVCMTGMKCNLLA